MPFPLVVVAAAIAGGSLVKLAKGALRNEDPRRGYCTWCGADASHAFFEDGLTWKKTGPIAILTGGIGTAVAGLVSRNIYRCSACGKRTLPCRMFRCEGMARSTDIYDDELCGKCLDANNVDAERAGRERSEEERNRIAEVLRAQEQRLQELEALRRKHADDTGRIHQLMQMISRHRETIARLRRELDLPPGLPA